MKLQEQVYSPSPKQILLLFSWEQEAEQDSSFPNFISFIIGLNFDKAEGGLNKSSSFSITQL